MNQTDETLVSSSVLERVKAEDPEAWRQLVQLFGADVYQWCRRYGLQASDASDVTQEVFKSVFTSVSRFRRDRAGESFRGWLCTITRNKVCDHFRRQMGRPEAAGGSEAKERLQRVMDLASDVSEETSVVDGNRSLFRRALDLIQKEFEPRTWQAFWRMAVEGHTSAEIAADLGMTKEAVRQCKRRVLLRLRKELEGLY